MVDTLPPTPTNRYTDTHSCLAALPARSPSLIRHIIPQVTPHNVTVGAGGAVIALSETNDEYEEMLLKATSVLGAIGHKNSRGRLGPVGSEPIQREDTKEGGGNISSHGVSAEKEQAAENWRGSVTPNGGRGRRAVFDPSAGVRVEGPLAAATLTPRGVREGGDSGGDGVPS